jgi:hypothetical protein
LPYSTIYTTSFPTNVSLGYFVQQGQPIRLAIFLVIIVLAAYSLFTVAVR